MYTIYKHTAPNGKVYIGATSLDVKDRFGRNGSKYSTQYFGEAIKLYGWDLIKHEILYEGLTKEEADYMEKEMIKKYRSNEREYGYNIAIGGVRGEHSQLTREKMSKTRKGRPLSDNHRRALSDALKGKQVSESHREHLRASHLGYVMPQSQKDKISASCKGKGTKAVLMLDMQETVLRRFESLMEAGKAVNAKSLGNISSCCKGKRKQSYGYKWKYEDLERREEK